MIRIRLSELKAAARNPGLRRSLETPRNFPTPYGQLNSAIRRFHREGTDSARAYLAESFLRSPYWGPGGTAQARSWAKLTLELFDNYVDLAEGDERPSLGEGIGSDVIIGEYTIGVKIDVVMLDSLGYVGRYNSWDSDPLGESAARLIATPIGMALENELGLGRTLGVEVWHLRTKSRFYFDEQTDLRDFGLVEGVIRAYLEPIG